MDMATAYIDLLTAYYDMLCITCHKLRLANQPLLES